MDVLKVAMNDRDQWAAAAYAAGEEPDEPIAVPDPADLELPPEKAQAAS